MKKFDSQIYIILITEKVIPIAILFLGTSILQKKVSIESASWKLTFSVCVKQWLKLKFSIFRLPKTSSQFSVDWHSKLTVSW